MKALLSDSQRQALKAAAQWFAALSADDVTPQQTLKWQRWYQSHHEHRWAWQQVEALRGQLHGMPGKLGYQALHQTRLARRQALKGMLLLLGVGGGWQLWRSPLGAGARADYRTATGEIRRHRLSDGSQLTLNTASAADVDFDPRQRLIRLHYGEIAIATASDPLSRPFLVATAQGSVRALGTEFTLREEGASTLLSVQRHAVEVTPAARPDGVQRVEQGYSLRFTADGVGPLTPAAPDNADWTQGLLSVSDKPLADVVADIARYRRGHLSCDPSAAHLRLSGTFRLDDTDRLLMVLQQTLPIKIQYISRYWVNISAA